MASITAWQVNRLRRQPRRQDRDGVSLGPQKSARAAPRQDAISGFPLVDRQTTQHRDSGRERAICRKSQRAYPDIRPTHASIVTWGASWMRTFLLHGTTDAGPASMLHPVRS